LIAPPAAESPQKAAAPKQPVWLPLKKIWTRYWWLPFLLAALGCALWIMVRGTPEARRRDQKIKDQQAACPARDAGILMLRCGAQSFDIGSWNRFRGTSIGPGKKNTIRTAGTASGERDLWLYKKGPALILKNVAAASCLVNGLEVKPSGRLRVVLPAVVQLSDKTRLHLEVLRPKVTSVPKERSGYEQPTELQTVS
jgi:hypothetical protein